MTFNGISYSKFNTTKGRKRISNRNFLVDSQFSVIFSSAQKNDFIFVDTYTTYNFLGPGKWRNSDKKEMT